MTAEYDFPAMEPAGRSYSLGRLPVSTRPTLGSAGVRFLHGATRHAIEMELAYVDLVQDAAKLIRDHFRLRNGTHQDFLLPPVIWAGHSDIGNIAVPNMRWRYTGPPEEQQKTGGFVDVSVSLISTEPAPDVSMLGLAETLTLSLAGGTATGAVAASASGMNEAVDLTFVGGGATGGGSDPDFSSVVLLLHMDGSNGSTTFADSSSNGLTVTASGDAQISTAQSKFGGSSLYLQGGNGELAIASNPLFAFNDFTVEMWFYKTGDDSSGRDTVFDMVSQELTITAGGTFNGNAHVNGVQLSGSFVAPSNTWTHVALTRSGSDCRLFLDGVQVVSRSISGQLSQALVNIGQSASFSGREFIGYIDELRVSSVARYTANFTPPTTPFPNA